MYRITAVITLALILITGAAFADTNEAWISLIPESEGRQPAIRLIEGDQDEVILEALDRAGGFLPLHDKSDPAEIRSRLQMSKKLFKKTIGVLYKEGELSIEEEGIRKK